MPLLNRDLTQVVIMTMLAIAIATVAGAQEREVVITGQVTGPGGAAVEGADVEASLPWGDGAVAVTDAAGGYRLAMNPGNISMHVRPPTAARLAEYFVDLGFQVVPFTQDFEVEAGYLLSGAVQLPDGSSPGEALNILFQPISFSFETYEWLRARTTAAGDFDIVAPPGVYWVGATPPAFYYSVDQPVDLSAGDVTSFVLNLSDEIVNPIPVAPPDASKIVFGEVDDLGEVDVTGAPGAAIGLAHVLLVNLGSLHQADAVSNADGSFSARIFAPPGSPILVKHGGAPERTWQALSTGMSMDVNPMPGTIIHLPYSGDGGGAGQAFAVVAPTDYMVDFLPETTNWVGGAMAITGALGPSTTFGPGDEVRLQGTIRVYSPEMNSSTELDEAFISGNLGLLMLFDGDGRPVKGGAYMSTRLTPTGFPIQGTAIPTRNTAVSLLVDEFVSAGEHSVEGDFSVIGELPTDLPGGLYRPFITLAHGGFPNTSEWVAAEVYGRPFDPNQVMLPPIVVEDGGGSSAERHLIWRLLMENPVQGTRGAGAMEDRGLFGYSNLITSQGAPYVIPRVDEHGRPVVYRLEPYMPRISSADRRIPSRPVIPFQLPGGALNVVVEPPDGPVRDLGSAEFEQSLSRTATTAGAVPINPATTQVNDLYSLTTNDERFRVTFDHYGRHYIIMAGTVEDIWGNEYSGGGAYEVWVANSLDVDPGVLPGTPLAVGDTFNPALQVYPRVPAEITLTFTLYPNSNPSFATIQEVHGWCNEYGLYADSDSSITADQPGEYRVDLVATYTLDSGEMYMGAMTWGGIVMTPANEAELVAHGRRGLDALAAIPGQSWFVSGRDLDIVPGAINHTYNPYFAGDMLWTRFTDDPTLAPDGGDSLILGVSVQDIVGTIEAAIETRAEVMKPETSTPGSFSERVDAGEIPLFSSTTSGYSPLIAPEDIDQIAYAYRSSQRPGVRVRELVGEDVQNGGYWRLDTVYDDQFGVGTLGDQPNDFKYQFVGAVYRDLVTGHSEYLGQGTGWIYIPDEDEVGSRCMPPFAGPGNGGWTTEGGPILTLKGDDIHIFILPTATRPGAVLEVGDTFRFSGHVMPTLDSEVEVIVTAPGGTEYVVDGRANSVGYFYEPNDDFVVDEPGAWTVDVRVWHDGQCSGGATIPPYPSGDVLGSDAGRFWFYVVEAGEERLEVVAPRPGTFAVGKTVAPIAVTGRVPAGLDDVFVDYTISIPGYILKHGRVTPGSGRYSILYDPVSLKKDFPNLDLVGRQDHRAGLSDTVSIGLLLSARGPSGAVYRANTVTLQGQTVSVGGDGKGLRQLPEPRHPSGRVP